jgi:hypothetical protein
MQQEMEDFNTEEKENYKFLITRMYLFKFGHIIDNTLESRIKYYADRAIKVIIFEMLMKELGFDAKEEFTTEMIKEGFKKYLNSPPKMDGLTVKLNEMMNPSHIKSIFLRVLSETFHPYADAETMVLDSRPNSFHGWIEESNVFFERYPKRVMQIFKEGAGKRLAGMFQFVELNAGNFDRITNEEFRLLLETEGTFSYPDLITFMNNGIDTTKLNDLPQNGMEIDQLAILLVNPDTNELEAIASSEIKSYWDAGDIRSKLRRIKVDIAVDCSRTLFSDAQLHYSRQKNREGFNILGAPHITDAYSPVSEEQDNIGIHKNYLKRSEINALHSSNKGPFVTFL